MLDLGHSTKKFKKKLLCRVPNSRHSAKKDVAEHRYAGQPIPSVVLLPRAWHSTKKSFAESLFLSSARHSAKNSLPSAILCRVRHSAKKVFAECLIFDTRQSSLHSAKIPFPVVIVKFQVITCMFGLLHNIIKVCREKPTPEFLFRKKPTLQLNHN